MTAIGDQPRIDTRVNTPDGQPLRGAARLPELPWLQPARDPLPDRIGRTITEQPALVAAGAAAGALIGAIRRRGGSEAPAVGVAPRDDELLRVMSWNVRDLAGPHGHMRRDDEALHAIGGIVDEHQPDVLVLQEVSRHSLLGGWRDGLAELADVLGATDAVLVPNGVRISGRTKGGAVLTFGDARIDDARGLRHANLRGEEVWKRAVGVAGPLRHVGLDVPDWMSHSYLPRTTADVLVTTGGGHRVRVLGVHLAGTGPSTGGTPGSTEAQQRQLVPLLETVTRTGAMTTIVAGDFNVNGGTAEQGFEVQEMDRAGMRDALTAAGVAPGEAASFSFPSHGPRRGIDRIYVSRDARVESARVLADGEVRQASDHLPVVADLALA